MRVVDEEPLTGEERAELERRFRHDAGCTRALELGAFAVILPLFLAVVLTTLFQRWLGDNPGCAAGAALFIVGAAGMFYWFRRGTAMRSPLHEVDNGTIYSFDVARAWLVDEEAAIFIIESNDGVRVLLRAWMCPDPFPQRRVEMKAIADHAMIVWLRAEGGEVEPEEYDGEELTIGAFEEFRRL